MQPLIDFFRPHALPLLFAVIIVAVLPLLAGYVVLMERKVMADMQVRLGPMRVGPHGLLQPIADAVKLLIKEDIIPEGADKWIFWVAPLISVTAAMLAYAALPFGPGFQIADLNIGLLFVLAVSSMGIYGIVLGGWSSNNNYSLLGALRSAAQVISYETAAGLALISGLLLAGSLSLRQVVEAQRDQGVWFVFLVPIGFFIYLVGSIAETNRAPFDLPEAESELVAGYMTEYSGFRWAIYFLAEYANMIVVASLATTLFLGGWLRPFPSWGGAAGRGLDFLPPLIFLGLTAYCVHRTPKQPVGVQKLVMLLFAGLCFTVALVLAVPLFLAPQWLAAIHGGFWFLGKVFLYLYVFMWFRFTFPRYRFDQLMRLGWQFLIPVAIINVMGVGLGLILHRELGWGYAGALGLVNMVVLLIGGGFAAAGRHRPGVAEGSL